MKVLTIVAIEVLWLVLIGCILMALQSKLSLGKAILENKRIGKYVRSINSNKKEKKKVLLVFVGVIFSYLVVFVFVFHTIKILIASLIFAIPVLLLPYIFIELKKIKRKREIVNGLQIYSLNIKNNIKNDNNIVLAMKRTKVEGPLKEHIARFVKDIDNGVNIYEAFNRLDVTVSVPEFSELVQTIQICYKSGGEFSNILEIYSKQISDKLIKQEKEKEKSLSTVITLAVMIALNVFMLVIYIPQNVESVIAFSGSILGRFLIDINAITTLLCLYFLYKIYKMEE